MKILVTGGTGFLGRHVVWRLAGQGHEVVFTGRNARAAQVVARESPAPVRFALHVHGAADAAAHLKAAAAGADAVVHCAALSSPWGHIASFEAANVGSTQEVLDACAYHRVPRLVHISTPSIYFAFEDRLDIHEDAPLPTPVNAYARTKLDAERLVGASSVNAIVLRPRGIFGPWDTTLLPRLLRVMHTGRMPVFRGGQALLDLCYVDNVVDAIALAALLPAQEYPARNQRVFNISNGTPIAVRDLLEQLSAAFRMEYRTVHLPTWAGLLLATALETAYRLCPGAEPPLTKYTAGTMAFSQTLNIDHARRALGYHPRVGIAEGIRRTADWHLTRNGGAC